MSLTLLSCQSSDIFIKIALVEEVLKDDPDFTSCIRAVGLVEPSLNNLLLSSTSAPLSSSPPTNDSSSPASRLLATSLYPIIMDEKRRKKVAERMKVLHQLSLDALAFMDVRKEAIKNTPLENMALRLAQLTRKYDEDRLDVLDELEAILRDFPKTGAAMNNRASNGMGRRVALEKVTTRTGADFVRSDARGSGRPGSGSRGREVLHEDVPRYLQRDAETYRPLPRIVPERVPPLRVYTSGPCSLR